MSAPAVATPAQSTTTRKVVPQNVISHSLMLLAHQMEIVPQSSKSHKAIGITSTFRGEGVTTIAEEFAAILAGWASREVLLIDANFSDSGLPGNSTGEEQVRGLTDLCLKQCEFDEAIYPSDIPNLMLLPAGAPTAVPIAINGLADEWNARFDFVVADLPPWSEWRLALPFIATLDGVVLVVESERIAQDMLLETQQQLRRLNIPLLGAVLNKQRPLGPKWLQRCLS